ncbi:MAG: ABC transporter ATP-binding protein [Thiohalomonadales bacterium]
MNQLEVHALSKTYSIDGKDLLVIDNISFSVKRGEFLCILGPSGCGKSTLLRMIADLEAQTTGEIGISIEDHHTEPSFGMVFQEQGLFPWMSVTENIRFILDNNLAMDQRNKTSLVADIVEKLGLTNFAAALPHQLSGGMRQRVSIGRAIANESDILLMDEPFVYLDYQTRLSLQQLLLDLWQDLKITILFVTHDIEEAVLLGDRVMVFAANPGRIRKIVDVPFTRPRQFLALKRREVFMDIVSELTDLISVDGEPISHAR